MLILTPGAVGFVVVVRHRDRRYLFVPINEFSHWSLAVVVIRPAELQEPTEEQEVDLAAGEGESAAEPEVEPKEEKQSSADTGDAVKKAEEEQQEELQEGQNGADTVDAKEEKQKSADPVDVPLQAKEEQEIKQKTADTVDAVKKEQEEEEQEQEHNPEPVGKARPEVTILFFDSLRKKNKKACNFILKCVRTPHSPRPTSSCGAFALQTGRGRGEQGGRGGERGGGEQSRRKGEGQAGGGGGGRKRQGERGGEGSRARPCIGLFRCSC